MNKILLFSLLLCMATSSIFGMDETDSNDNYQSPPTGLNFFLKNEPERVVKYKTSLKNTVQPFLPVPGLPQLVMDYIGDDINERDLARDQRNDLMLVMREAMIRDGFIPKETTQGLLTSVETARNNMHSTKTQRTEKNMRAVELQKRHEKRYWVPYATCGLTIAGMACWLYKNSRAAK